jgi:hypothetical protein
MILIHCFPPVFYYSSRFSTPPAIGQDVRHTPSGLVTNLLQNGRITPRNLFCVFKPKKPVTLGQIGFTIIAEVCQIDRVETIVIDAQDCAQEPLSGC